MQFCKTFQHRVIWHFIQIKNISSTIDSPQSYSLGMMKCGIHFHTYYAQTVLELSRKVIMTSQQTIPTPVHSSNNYKLAKKRNRLHLLFTRIIMTHRLKEPCIFVYNPLQEKTKIMQESNKHSRSISCQYDRRWLGTTVLDNDTRHRKIDNTTGTKFHTQNKDRMLRWL